MNELVMLAHKAIIEDDMEAYERIQEEVRKKYKEEEGVLLCQN